MLALPSDIQPPDAGTSPAPHTKAEVGRVTGENAMPLGVPTIVALAIGLAVGAFAESLMLGLLVGLGGWAWYAGDRFRVVVRENDIRVDWMRFAIIRMRSETYSLEARVVFYDGFDFDAQGLELSDLRCPGGSRFGPIWPLNRMVELKMEIEELVDRARERHPPHSRTLPVNAAWPTPGEQFAPGSARHHDSGRLASARSDTPLEIGGVAIPVGSQFAFNENVLGWVEPTKPDALTSIEVAAPAWLEPLRSHIDAGARLEFITDAMRLVSVERARTEPIHVHGMPCRGDLPIRFGDEGEVVECTLAANWGPGELRLPAGTVVRVNASLNRVLRREGLEPMRLAACTGELQAPFGIGELVLPATARLDLNAHGRPVAFSMDGGEIQAEGQTIACGYGAIPLLDDGTVDFAHCRARGWLR